VSEAARVPATRANLLRARRRLTQVGKGEELLRRKREALVTELFRLARPALGARAEIDRQAARAYPMLLDALAVHGTTGLRALAWPERELSATLRPATVWGVPLAEIVERPSLRRTPEARALPGVSSGPAAALAAEEFEKLLELLLEAAPREQLMQRLGIALGQTTRQLRGLEQRVEPTLRARMLAIRRTLEERERDERIRLKLMGRRKAEQRRTH
jgi:V/A-type H+-transporting ATPase subunit D